MAESSNKKEPALEDALIAIQKAFSRVNQQTAERNQESPGSPLAHIIGNVDANLKTTGRVVEDRFIIDSGGDIEIAFSGAIDTDIEESADKPEVPEPAASAVLEDIFSMNSEQISKLDSEVKIGLLEKIRSSSGFNPQIRKFLDDAFMKIVEEKKRIGQE